MKPAGIPDWIDRWFSDSLVIHEKARKLIKGIAAHETDLPLLLDAIEYLGTDARGTPAADGNERSKEHDAFNTETGSRCDRGGSAPAARSRGQTQDIMRVGHGMTA